MKQKRNKMWKRMFSMLLVMAMLITAIPVTAFAEPEARAIRVWFEYDNGDTQELDDSGAFHLTTDDKGTFKAEGYNSSRVGWKVVESLDRWNTASWAEYNSGVFQPYNKSIVLSSWLEDSDTKEKLVEFTVNVEKTASIVEVKAFSGDKEISMGQPCKMNGSEAQTITLKVRKEGSGAFEPLPLSHFDIEKVSGKGMILPADGTFSVDGQEAVFKATLKTDPRVFVEFKAVSLEVALQTISVSVPNVWYINGWNGLGGYYVGIEEGDDSDNNYQINYTPFNASDKEVVWEPLTEDIATHMEVYGNGIVPKKAGIAKFKVSSKSNPGISTEVSVDFRYKDPLTAANVEQEEYTVEEGNWLEFNIKATPEYATEQRFHWSYSKEGIVEVKDSVIQDVFNVKTTQHVINALNTGKVTVTGVPFDETGSCKPVSFDVVVTKDGEVPQGDALAMAKEDIAHGVQYLQGKSLEKYKDEWNIFSILRSGATIEQGKLDKYYESVVKQLNTSSKNMRVTDLARVALALEAMGKNPTDVGGFNVLEAIYNHKDMMTDSSNCPIFGLLALDGRNYEIPKDAKWSRKDLVKQILKFQKASGGFGLSLDNDTTGIDMTGMALQALAPYYDNSAYPEVKPAVDKALKHFKDNITINAGFLDMGSENSCTTAQVLTAVSALNIDPTVKENGFVQNGNNMISNLHTYKKDAGFAWQATMQGQEMATQQVTYALVAYQRMAEGQTRLYDFTDVPEEKPSVDPEDEKAAKAVEDQINAIGKVTLESKKAIEAARAAYEKLSEAQKKLVGNLETLTKAEAELKKLEEQQGQQGQEETDQKAAKEVEEKINAIGEKITLESKKAIEEARAAYEKLSEAQKKLVSNLETLTKAEAELKKLEEEANTGYVIISVERFTIGQGFIHEPVKVPFEKGDNAATLLKKVIGAENFVGEDSYLSAIEGADLGVDKVVVPDYIAEISNNQVTTETARNNGNDGDNALGEFDYSFMSGWMYHVNGESVNYGISSYKPANGDVLRFQFTMYGYGTDLTGTSWGNPNPVITISNKDNLVAKMADVNENRDRWMAVPAVKAVYDEAVKAMENVITPKAEIDAITERLDKAMKDHELTENDQEVANTVIEKINGIGKVTLESKKAIEEARAAYNKLSENQKKLVNNIEILTKAEAELKKLEEEAAQEEADQKAAKEVEEKINAVGEKITLESKKAIEAARAAYEKLSEAQKKLVGNLETLTKAEAELKKLEEQQGQQGQEKPETSTVTLVNKKYGVSLQGEGLTEDMELQVEALNKDSKDVERMRKEITSKNSIFRLFNIKLMKNGKEIQLPQKAVLSIPVGEKYNGKELVVLACSDKDIRQLKGKVANGSVSVEVTELMSFGVVVDTAASEKEVNSGSGTGTANSNTGGNSSGGKGVKTGDQTPMEVLVLLLTLSGAAVVMTAGKKRREQK